MKKTLLFLSLISAILFVSNQNSKAGLFGTRGKKVLLSDGGTCCRYALANSNCNRSWPFGDC